MVVEFLEERTEGCNVAIYEMDNLSMFIGDVTSGLAVYTKYDKSFQFYIAKNIEAILETDEKEIYDQVDIETFIERLCEQDDEDI